MKKDSIGLPESDKKSDSDSEPQCSQEFDSDPATLVAHHKQRLGKSWFKIVLFTRELNSINGEPASQALPQINSPN